jgi:ribosomal protein L9
MEIILIQDVDNLGGKNELVKQISRAIRDQKGYEIDRKRFTSLMK